MRWGPLARRAWCLLLAVGVSAPPCFGDGSGPAIASYYDRHAAIIDGAAYGWSGTEPPRRLLEGVVQVGVGRDRYLALTRDGALLAWTSDARAATRLMTGIASFAAGESGAFAIDVARALWRLDAGKPPRRVAANVVAASIGDGADYYVTGDGRLFVKGRAHRGQYGDGRLTATADFVQTASDAVDVKAHTGHALYLSKTGIVFGTGGNIHGPLSHHGLGDKAVAWGQIFADAKAIATGASHSAAIAKDGSLWLWGAGHGIAPLKVLDGVVAVAAGSRATIARTRDGAIWQWDGGGRPRKIWPAPR
jgi:alpha-tubulin suppressor-like RCC1 family protein